MLETQGLSKARRWEILQDVLISLDGFAKAKFESSLLKNPDIIQYDQKNAPLIKIHFFTLK